MSKNILFILPNLVKERTELHSNVDDKLIIPKIKIAQDMYLMPLLGTTLFNKILTDIDNNSLSGDYLILVEDYIVDIMVNYTMAKLAPALNAQFWNNGVSTKSVNGSTTVNGNDLKNVVSDFISQGDFYSQRCKRYLQQHAQNKYPEYYNQIAGIDIMIPETNVWECPISLGGIDNVKPHKYFNQ